MTNKGKRKNRAGTASHLCSIHELRGALNYLGSLSPNMTVLQARTFIAIAAREGRTIVELKEEVETSQPNTTRMVDLLSSFGRGGKKGLKWVERRDVVGDRRMREVWLTPKGRKVLEELGFAH